MHGKVLNLFTSIIELQLIMLISAFSTGVSYRTLGVVEPPEFLFNDVQQRHSDQGFSWRPRNVSFFMMGHALRADVEVCLEQMFNPDPLAQRIIRVPYKVESCEGVGIFDPVDNPRLIKIPTGDFALLFETGFVGEERAAILDPSSRRRCDPTDTPNWCRFTFVPVGRLPKAEILRADPGLKVPAKLAMDGRSA